MALSKHFKRSNLAKNIFEFHAWVKKCHFGIFSERAVILSCLFELNHQPVGILKPRQVLSVHTKSMVDMSQHLWEFWAAFLPFVFILKLFTDPPMYTCNVHYKVSPNPNSQILISHTGQN